MHSSELTKILKDCYHNAPDKHVALTIHLFGIEFSEALKGQNIREICIDADVPKSFATEIRKGMKLAEFVTLK